MTAIVTIALQEKLARAGSTKKAKATPEEVRAIAKRFQSHLAEPVEDHGTLLYDERGAKELVDTSALLAIVLGKPEADQFAEDSRVKAARYQLFRLLRPRL